LRKELQMDRDPNKPGQEAAQANLANLQNCKTLTDDGQVPLIEVVERR